MLVAQIVLAAALFMGLLYVADRFASRWTVEDAVSLAEQRRARLAERQARQSQRRTGRVRGHRIGLAGGRRPPEPAPYLPSRRPLQVVAADLRRLSRQLALVPSGSPLVRWKALWAAYDGVLIEAAEMLEIPQELGEQPPAGVARDIERVRLLAALESTGLVVRG